MNPLILIAAVAALVWGAVLVWRGSLLAGCAVYLLLACCLGVHFATFDLGITLSLDRLFLVFLVGAFVVQARLGKVEIKPLQSVDYVLLGMIGVLGVSMFLHDWRTSVPGDVPIIQHLLNGYVIPCALYFVARQAAISERNTTVVLAILCGFGVYLAVTGLLETAGQWSLVFPRYIADPDIGLHFGRARGPMVHSVTFGVYLTTAVLAFWLWQSRWPKSWRVFVLPLLGALLAAAIYLSKTRSVWLGGATGLLVVLGFTLRGRVRVAVLGTMVIGGLLVGATKLDDIMGLQREGTVQDTRQSASMRASFAYVSWRMFQDRPLFGFGFGQFPKAKLPYLHDRSVDLHLESIRDYVHHNTFLSLLTETGLVGLALLLALHLGWAWCGWKLARSQRAPPWAQRQGVLLLGVLGIYFWQMMGHEITFTPLDHALLFTLAGVTVGLHSQWVRAAEAAPRGSPSIAARPPSPVG